MEQYIKKVEKQLKDEIKSQIENNVTIRNVKISRISNSLFGKTLLKFDIENSNINEDDEDRISIGDYVGIRTSKKKPGSDYIEKGIVYKIEAKQIVISCEYFKSSTTVSQPYGWFIDEYEYSNLEIDRLVNESKYKQIKKSFEKLEQNSKLPDLLFKNSSFESNDDDDDNIIQIKDIDKIIEQIPKFVEDSKRILICGQSNSLIDNMLKSLVEESRKNNLLKLTNIGRPLIKSKELSKYSLDHKIKNCESGKLIKGIRKEIKQSKTRSEIPGLNKEIQEREKKLVAQILNNSNIILSTNLESTNRYLNEHNDFDYVLILIDEEASKKLVDFSSLLPINKGKKLIISKC